MKYDIATQTQCGLRQAHCFHINTHTQIYQRDERWIERNRSPYTLKIVDTVIVHISGILLKMFCHHGDPTRNTLVSIQEMISVEKSVCQLNGTVAIAHISGGSRGVSIVSMEPPFC